MSTNLYIADKGGFVESAFNMECNSFTAPDMLEKIGINPEGPQGTVGTIKNANLPKAIIDQARVMGRAMDYAGHEADRDRNQRFLNLLVYAHDIGRDVGWS